MPIVRVVVFDEQNFFQRLSSPEDTFLIEAIDASGSDENIIRIGQLSASSLVLGRDGIYTFVSGVLSGNFITGTFYGDAEQVRGVVHQINSLTGSFEFVPGSSNVTISTDVTTFPNKVAISASISGTIIQKVDSWVFGGEMEFKHSSYKVGARAIFRGTSAMGTPSALKIIANSKNGGLVYFRLYDLINLNEIAEVSLTSSISKIFNMSPILNLPTNESIFEIQGKVTGSNEGYIDAVHWYY